MTFPRCRAGLQGLSACDPSVSSERTTGSVPRGLGGAFRAPAVTLNLNGRSRRFASHRIRSRRCPASDIPPVRQLPGDASATVRPTQGQMGRRVPTSWFLTTSPACSAQKALGLLRPKAGRDSLRFPVGTPTMADRSRRPLVVSSRRLPVDHRFPQRVSHPSKNSPRQQPYRVTAAVTLMSFPTPTRPPDLRRERARPFRRTERPPQAPRSPPPKQWKRIAPALP